MSEVYRLAALEDAEKLLHVISRAYRSIKEHGIQFHAVNADLAMIEGNLKESTSYVLELEGVIAATISVKPLPEVTEYPFLYWFAVDPDFNNRGVGSKLLRYVEEEIVRDTLKAPAVTLATSLKHPWLLPMYERKGYASFFQRPLGDDDTLVFLTKVLVPERLALSPKA